MFKKLRICNFRSICDSGEIELGNLNVFIGPNNSGKSSFLYPLLLLKQTLESTDQDIHLITCGKIVNTGSFLDLIRSHDKSNKLEIHFEILNDIINNIQYSKFKKRTSKEIDRKVAKFSISFGFSEQSGSLQVVTFKTFDSKEQIIYGGELINDKWEFCGLPENILKHSALYLEHFLPYFVPTGPKPSSQETIEKAFGFFYYTQLIANAYKHILKRHLMYIGPLREKIPSYGFMGSESCSELTPTGENLIWVLSKKELVKNSKNTLLGELEFWMNKKFKILKNLRIENLDKDNTIRSIFADDMSGKYTTNIAYTGSGLSQLVPVIVQLALLPRNGCLIVEQPELHLHPAMQAELGNLFVHYASKEKQILIETHSEHLILRIRRKVAEGEIAPSQVKFFYVNKIQGNTVIKPLALKENGHFTSWPKGFFEEGLKDSLAIFDAGKNK